MGCLGPLLLRGPEGTLMLVFTCPFTRSLLNCIERSSGTFEYCEPHDGAAMELVLIWVEGRRTYDAEARRLLAAAGGVCVEGDASSGSE